MKPIKIESAHGSAELHPTGAMIGPVRLRPDPADPREVEPFFLAPWSDDTGPDYDALPGIMRGLRGEWPCVPFGNAHPDKAARSDLPQDWRVDPTWRAADGDGFFHGFGAHNPWRLRLENERCGVAEIDCPPDHAIERLSRRVQLLEDAATLRFELEITPRRTCRLPVALHPVFRLPPNQGRGPQAKLTFSGDVRAWTFPVEVEPGRSLLVADQRGVPVDAVRDVHGATLDLRRLPFGHPSEDLVLLTGLEGCVTLTNAVEGYVVTLRWDAEALPSCLLWISNGGRLSYPWLGRVCALGIEPCAAPFDLGPAYAGNADTPLRRAGVSTEVGFHAQTSRRIDYSIGVARTR